MRNVTLTPSPARRATNAVDGASFWLPRRVWGVAVAALVTFSSAWAQAEEPATETAPASAESTESAEAAAKPAAELPARPPSDVDALRERMRSLLLLREVIETRPLVVGGLKLYVEMQPVVEQQRLRSTSELTVGLAPDRVVLSGVF